MGFLSWGGGGGGDGGVAMIARRLNGKFQILLTPSCRHPLLQFPELDLGTLGDTQQLSIAKGDSS